MEPKACGKQACIYAVPNHCRTKKESILRVPFYDTKKAYIEQYREVDPNEEFSIHVESDCVIDPSNYKAPKKLLSKGKVLAYGGIALDNIAIESWTPLMLVEFTNVIYGVHRMRSMGFNHGDIHIGNIVYDGHNFRIIDVDPSIIIGEDHIAGDNSMYQHTPDPEALSELIFGHPYSKEKGYIGKVILNLFGSDALAMLDADDADADFTLDKWIRMLDKYLPDQTHYLDKYRIKGADRWPYIQRSFEFG